jgi:pimeloyl-ACP methyl ester carboxylesterase
MKLNYKKLGESKQKIIIVHGLFGSLDNWMTHGRYLAEKGFEIYLIDQRNHGKSPHEEGLDYELMAADLLEFLTDHNIENPILIGHSMGGKTIMQFAMTYSNSIKKMIVVDIAPKYYLPHHQTIIEAFRSVDIKNLKSRKDAEISMSAFVQDAGVLQFLLKNLERTSDGFDWKVNLEEVIKNIENVGKTYEFEKPCLIPTLFIRGSKSDYILNEDRELLKAHFPNSMLVTINDAGHWVHAEQYEKFIKTLEVALNS